MITQADWVRQWFVTSVWELACIRPRLTVSCRQFSLSRQLVSVDLYLHRRPSSYDESIVILSASSQLMHPLDRQSSTSATTWLSATWMKLCIPSRASNGQWLTFMSCLTQVLVYFELAMTRFFNHSGHNDIFCLFDGFDFFREKCGNVSKNLVWWESLFFLSRVLEHSRKIKLAV